MSSKEKEILVGKPVKSPLSLKELGEILIKHYGITDGKYELMVEFKIGVGAFGSMPDERLPGAMVGVHKVGLVKAKKDSPSMIDASECQTD